MLVWTSAVSAATIEPLQGWVTVDKLDKALAYARKKNRPVVFMVAFKKSTCPLHNGCARSYMREKSIAGAVKVLVYAEEPKPAEFLKVSRQVGNEGKFVPRMYVADPGLRILGFVKYKAGKDLKPIVGLSKKIMSWQKKADKTVAGADKLAAAGKYKAASKLYEKVLAEDRKYARFVHRTWGDDVDKETVAPIYYAGLNEKLEGLPTLADARLAEAEALFEKQEYKAAEKLLSPMVADGADFEAVKKAKALLAKIQSAK